MELDVCPVRGERKGWNREGLVLNKKLSQGCPPLESGSVSRHTTPPPEFFLLVEVLQEEPWEGVMKYAGYMGLAPGQRDDHEQHGHDVHQRVGRGDQHVAGGDGDLPRQGVTHPEALEVGHDYVERAGEALPQPSPLKLDEKIVDGLARQAEEEDRSGRDTGAERAEPCADRDRAAGRVCNPLLSCVNRRCVCVNNRDDETPGISLCAVSQQE